MVRLCQIMQEVTRAFRVSRGRGHVHDEAVSWAGYGGGLVRGDQSRCRGHQSAV